jgi:biopolymer transport protein ExbB/TolQ
MKENPVLNMTKEYRAELRKIRTQRRQIERAMLKRARSNSTLIKRIKANAEREIARIEKCEAREERSANRQLATLEKRVLILEGRLSK